MVGLFEYANYANSKEQIKIFHTVTIPPKLRRIEATIDMQLLRPADSKFPIIPLSTIFWDINNTSIKLTV